MHSTSGLLPAQPQTSTAVGPLTSVSETRCPRLSAEAGPQPASLRPRSPPDCSRRWVPALGAGSGLLQAGGRARVPGRDSRQAGRVPGDAGGVGNPGGSREGGGPGPGAGGGVRRPSFQFVPLFEIGAGGALRSRDGASPIGAALVSAFQA